MKSKAQFVSGVLLLALLSVASFLIVRGSRQGTKTAEAEYDETFAKKDSDLRAYFMKMDLFPGKISRTLKEYADTKTTPIRKMEIVTYLRQTTIKPQDKPLVRAALQDPRYGEIRNHLELCLLHAIQDHPEESDKEFVLGLLEQGRGLGWFAYALPDVWDERYRPCLLRAVAASPRSVAAIELIGTIHERRGVPFLDAVPALEAALKDQSFNVMNAAHDTLFILTGRRYEYKYYHKGDEKKVP